MKGIICALVMTLGLGSCAHDLPSYAMRIETANGLGSGTKISEDEILTAYHVAYGHPDLYVVNERDERVDGYLSFADENLDIAIVKAKINGKVAKVSCRERQVGTSYKATGNPLGFKFIRSVGRIAGEPREYSRWKSVYVADGAIIHGVSGAGAIGSSGELIGMVVGIAVSSMPLPAPSGFSLIVPSTEICKALKIDS